MNEIISISHYSEKSARVKIANRVVASKVQPGQFVIIKFSETGQRIPFPVVECDGETGELDIIIHRADGLDEILGLIQEGGVLPDLLGPLGMPAVIDENKAMLFIGDGAGFVPLLPLIHEARRKGCQVHAIVSEQSSQTKCLLGDINSACNDLTVAREATVLEIVRKWIEMYKPDKMVFSGPTMLMKNLTAIAREHNIPADCVLNMLMIDGIGICGVCRVMIGGVQKQTCIDGPVFNAWDVDFDYILNRQRSFV